jgi:uncharacterized protein YerC
MKQHPKIKHITISEDGTKIYSSLSNKFLSTFVNDNGYVVTSITMSKNVYKRYRVHRLVAETYLDKPIDYSDVNHKDHNKQNNHYNNLEWCDRAYNIKYSIDRGFNPSQGQTHPSATYNEDSIRLVCKLLVDGLRNCDIATITGVHKDTISKIRHKEIWCHVVSEYEIPISHRRGRISVKKVKVVCDLIEKHCSNVHIKEVTGLSLFTISKIRNRKTYRHVSKDYSF